MEVNQLAPSHSRRSGLLRPTVMTGLLAALLWVHAGTLQAQPVPSVAPAASEITPIERARRDAEKVFQWIRMHSDKPRRAPPPQASSERPAIVSPVVAKKADAPATAKRLDGDRAPTPVAPAQEAVRVADGAASQAAHAASAEPASAALAAVSGAAAPVTALPEAPIPDEDVPLVAVLQTEPEFPASLMRQLRKGNVQVAFTVQPDGSVSQARPLLSSHPRLARTAVATVTQWRFQPLRRAQSAVVELGFNLEE